MTTTFCTHKPVRLDDGYDDHPDFKPPVTKANMSTEKPTGGSVSYYTVHIDSPTSLGPPYKAECNDIIEALGMNYAEGNALKAIWRSCAARNLANSKPGYAGTLYDAEKVVFFGQRMVEQAIQVTPPAPKFIPSTSLTPLEQLSKYQNK